MRCAVAVHGGAGVELESVNCGLCGSDSWSPILQAEDVNYAVPGLFRIVQCPRCGLVYQNPRPTSRAIADIYPEDYGPHRSDESGLVQPTSDFPLWKERMKRQIADLYYFREKGHGNGWRRWSTFPFYLYARMMRIILLPRGEDENRCVLDIGCGTGRFLRNMATQGWRVFGVEPDPAAAARAQETLGSGRITGTLEQSSLAPASCDLVTMWHVIEHLSDPVQTMREVHRLLKPGGWLVIMTPNIASLEFRLFRDNWQPLELPRHFYHFSPHTLRLTLRVTGFHSMRIAFQIEPITLEASFRNLFGVDRFAPVTAYRACARNLLWIPSVLLAWAHTSGIIVAYAQKQD